MSSPIATLIPIAARESEAAVAESNFDAAFLALLAQAMPAPEGAGFRVPGAETAGAGCRVPGAETAGAGCRVPGAEVGPVQVEANVSGPAELMPMPVEFIPRNGSVLVTALPAAIPASLTAPPTPALPAESALREGSTLLMQRPVKTVPSARARVNRIAYQRPDVAGPKVKDVAKPEIKGVATPEAPLTPAVVVHPVPQVMPPRVADAAPAVPVAEAPVVEAPVVDAPVVDAPVTGGPVVNTPKATEAPRGQGIPQGTPRMNAEVVATTPAAARSPAIRAAMLILDSMTAGQGSGCRVQGAGTTGFRVQGAGVAQPELPATEAVAPAMGSIPADVQVTELVVPESTLKQEAPRPKGAAPMQAEQPAQPVAPQVVPAAASGPMISMRVRPLPATEQEATPKPAARETSAPTQDAPAPAVRVEAPAKPTRQEHGFDRAPKAPAATDAPPRPEAPAAPAPAYHPVYSSAAPRMGDLAMDAGAMPVSGGFTPRGAEQTGTPMPNPAAAQRVTLTLDGAPNSGADPMRIRVSVHNGIVRATILSASHHTAQLSEHVSELKDALEDRGFKRASVAVHTPGAAPAAITTSSPAKQEPNHDAPREGFQGRQDREARERAREQATDDRPRRPFRAPAEEE